MIASDRRHLARMATCIAAMRSGEVELAAGADTLLFLRDALSEPDRGWSDALTAHLATLESAATASPVQRATMGARFAEVVHAALSALEELVAARSTGTASDD